MLYKFKSKAAGDIIMLEPHGDQLLRLLGRSPASKGIFEVDAMPALMATLQSAIEAEGAAREEASPSTASQPSPGSHEPEVRGDGVSLRRRAWPLLEMLRRSHAAREAIVWGA
ncbi:MAG: DUF1840 domain-containing protein [Burkholderiaceae bacterium]